MMDETYPIGTWIRFYTNSLRYPGAATTIGLIVDTKPASSERPALYITRNAVSRNEVPPHNIVGAVPEEELEKIRNGFKNHGS